MSHILIILRIRILGIAGLYLPEHRACIYRCTELLFTGFATLVCQRNCVFLCKGTKLKIVMPVFCGTELRFCGTELLGPKPVIPTNAFAAFATLVCQRNCVFLCKGTKAKEFGEAEFWDSMPVFALECFSANETGVLISEFSAS